MKALSVRQPWAWAIVHAGMDVVNRATGTRYRGPLYIHASKCYDRAGKHWMNAVLGLYVPPELPRGGIVGKAELIGCTRTLASPWFRGPVGLILGEREPLPFMACRGKLGLFEEAEQEVLALW